MLAAAVQLLRRHVDLRQLLLEVRRPSVLTGEEGRARLPSGGELSDQGELRFCRQSPRARGSRRALRDGGGLRPPPGPVLGSRWKARRPRSRLGAEGRTGGWTAAARARWSVSHSPLRGPGALGGPGCVFPEAEVQTHLAGRVFVPCVGRVLRLLLKNGAWALAGWLSG